MGGTLDVDAVSGGTAISTSVHAPLGLDRDHQRRKENEYPSAQFCLRNPLEVLMRQGGKHTLQRPKIAQGGSATGHPSGGWGGHWPIRTEIPQLGKERRRWRNPLLLNLNKRCTNRPRVVKPQVVGAVQLVPPFRTDLYFDVNKIPYYSRLGAKTRGGERDEREREIY